MINQKENVKINLYEKRLLENFVLDLLCTFCLIIQNLFQYFSNITFKSPEYMSSFMNKIVGYEEK